MALDIKNTGTGLQSGIGGALLGIGTGLVGMIGQNEREQRSLLHQRQLQQQQYLNQTKLNRQGADLQYEMWQKTNYPAQLAMMKEAGLNPALMYGMSGGGGTTTGSQGGGSAASAQAPMPQPMELQTALQAAMTAANIKVAESQAEKNEAEASSIKGEEGTVGASQIMTNLADAMNKESMAKLNNLGYEIGYETKGDQIDKAFYEVEYLAKQNNLTESQTELAREKIATEGISRQLMRANIQVNEQQVKKMIEDVKQGWQKLSNELQQISIGNQANKLRAMEGKTRLEELKQDFILGAIGKEIDLQKLNIEQQKIFTSIFNGLLGSYTTQSLRPY